MEPFTVRSKLNKFKHAHAGLYRSEVPEMEPGSCMNVNRMTDRQD